MKNIYIGILGLVVFVFINGCSSNADPQLRIRNEQLNKVSVKIQTSGNNTLSTNDVEPGQTTSYQTASVGIITATSVNQNESVSFLAAKNAHYTIILNSGKPPSLRVDQ